MQKPFERRLFHRYFLLFAANLVFFIIILSGITYFVFVQRFIQNQVAQAGITSLTHVSDSVEYFVRKTDDIAKYYALFDTEAISLSYRSIAAGSSFYQFLERVRNQGYIDGNIHSIYLYYRTWNRVIDVSRSEMYSLYPGDTSLSRAEREGNFYDTGWLATALEGPYNEERYVLMNTRPLYVVSDPANPDVFERNVMNTHPNADVITLIRPFENRTDDPRGYVVANLNERAISRYLRNAGEGSPVVTFIITGRGAVVSREDRSFIGRDLSGDDAIERILDAENTAGFLTARVEGRKQAFVYVKSPYVDWIYISMIPYAYLTRDLRFLTRIVLITVVLVGVSAVLSVYVLSKRATSPIEMVFEKIKRIAADHASDPSRGDIRMYGTLVDQFKKSYDRLGKLVFDNRFLLKYHFVNRLIAGECSTIEREEGLQELGIRFDRPGFAVVTVVIDEFPRVLQSYSLQDVYVAKQAIIDIFEKTLNEHFIAAGAGGEQRHLVLVVNGVGGASEPVLAGHLEAAVRMTDQLLQLGVSAGIGGFVDSIEDLQRSQRESIVALQNRVRKGRSTVIRYEEVRASLDEAPHDLSQNEESIVNAMRSGQKDRCLNALADLVREMKQHGLPRGQVERVLLELMVLIHRQLAHAEVRFDEVCTTSFTDVLDGIATFETLDALHETLGGVLGCICDHYGGSRKGHNAEVIERVMAHLRTHYAEMLSLDVVAGALKISPQHLSRLVKAETGVNFLEYLTNVRMDKAEELLVGTTLPVREIAAKVGYQTYRTFLLNFRAHTAMIPTQYRKMKNPIAEG